MKARHATPLTTCHQSIRRMRREKGPKNFSQQATNERCDKFDETIESDSETIDDWKGWMGWWWVVGVRQKGEWMRRDGRTRRSSPARDAADERTKQTRNVPDRPRPGCALCVLRMALPRMLLLLLLEVRERINMKANLPRARRVVANGLPDRALPQHQARCCERGATAPIDGSRCRRTIANALSQGQWIGLIGATVAGLGGGVDETIFLGLIEANGLDAKLGPQVCSNCFPANQSPAFCAGQDRL